jgi:hypothetical protein
MNQQQFDQAIDTLSLEIEDLKKTRQEIYADKNLIPEVQDGFAQGKYRIQIGDRVTDTRCNTECGHFDGGNRTCRKHSAGNGCIQGIERNRASQIEKRNHAVQVHINPISNQIKDKENELAAIKEKSTIPILREQLLSTLRNYQSLSKTDPTYRQQKIEAEQSLYSKARKIDELEIKHKFYSNIPIIKPEIITPDPIVQTTLDYELNKRPLLILGALGLIGLFLIWRMK